MQIQSSSCVARGSICLHFSSGEVHKDGPCYAMPSIVCMLVDAKTCKCIEATGMSQTELTTASPMHQVRRHKDSNKANRNGIHQGGKGWQDIAFSVIRA